MLVHLEVFRLRSTNIGEEVKGGYKVREKVYLIDMGDYIVLCSES